MMFSDIVLELERKKFDRIFDEAKKRAGVQEDWQLDAGRAASDVVARFKAHVKSETGNDFPDEPMQQLELAIRAVFNSWNNERAFRYREIEKIPHDLGTAVNVQTMVFGNMGADSGHGRRLHARRIDRRAQDQRRVPDQRAGRGRRRRHPHAVADRAARARQRRRSTSSSPTSATRSSGTTAT